MVAASPYSPLVPLPASAIAGRGGLVQFTVEDALSMIRQGMVSEDASAELINGFIVHTDRSAFGGDPSMHSPGHRKSVRRLTALVATIDTPARHVQIQSPIICSTRQMPEPDFAIVRGSDDDYTDSLPTAADVLCVVEVADSSLERDRDEKGPVYARAGIPQYVILNLRNRTAEVHTAGNGDAYPSPKILTESEIIDLRIGETETLAMPLAELLP